VFKAGQLVSLESNAAVHMDAAIEDATFAGVVGIGAPAGTTEVLVLKVCQVEIDCALATFGAMAGIKYSAGSSSVDYSIIADSGADTIGFVAKEYTTAVTRVRVNFDVEKLQKLDAVAA
jgi:hypothetical protein